MVLRPVRTTTATHEFARHDRHFNPLYANLDCFGHAGSHHTDERYYGTHRMRFAAQNVAWPALLLIRISAAAVALSIVCLALRLKIIYYD
jgi:hypothetical protein